MRPNYVGCESRFGQRVISVNLYSNYINIVWKCSFKHLQMIDYMFCAIHDGFIKKLTARAANMAAI